MRDRYPPDGPDQEWPDISPPRHQLPPDPTLRFDRPAGDRRPPGPDGGSRADGLRRLSRLTWRATQLSAIAAAAFAVLFARSAPAHSASSQTAVRPSTAATPTASPTPTPTPTHTHRAARKPKRHKAPPSTPPSSAAAQPASAPPPSPTLAPPSTPPAPAPTPSPVQSTSSGSTGGG
ncbi:MAG TPA: hypothetical protein VIF35_22675 [Streptosporangiaceae bacterium]